MRRRKKLSRRARVRCRHRACLERRDEREHRGRHRGQRARPQRPQRDAPRRARSVRSPQRAHKRVGRRHARRRQLRQCRPQRAHMHRARRVVRGGVCAAQCMHRVEHGMQRRHRRTMRRRARDPCDRGDTHRIVVRHRCQRRTHRYLARVIVARAAIRPPHVWHARARERGQHGAVGQQLRLGGHERLRCVHERRLAQRRIARGDRHKRGLRQARLAQGGQARREAARGRERRGARGRGRGRLERHAAAQRVRRDGGGDERRRGQRRRHTRKRRDARVRRAHMHLEAAVAHRAAELAVARVDRHKDTERRVRAHLGHAAVDHAALAKHERAMRLKQRVEAVQHRRGAQIRIFEQDPRAAPRRAHERTVDPLKLAGAARTHRKKRTDARVCLGVKQRRSLGEARAEVCVRRAERRTQPLGRRERRAAVGAAARARGRGVERGAQLGRRRTARIHVVALLKRAKHVHRVCAGTEAQLLERAARELGQHPHEARLASARGARDDRKQAQAHAVARGLEARELGGQQRERGGGPRSGARHDSMADARLVRRDERGRRRRGRRTPKRVRREACGGGAVRIGAQPRRVQRKHIVERVAGAARRQLEPAQQVAQVKLPRRAGAAEAVVRRGRKGGVEAHQRCDVDTGVQRRADRAEVRVAELGDVHLDEAIQQRPGQALARAALVVRVLRGKQPKGGMLGKRAADLGHVYAAAVVEARVEALEHRLRREVHFVEQDPRAALHRVEERGRAPRKLARAPALDRQLGAKQVDQLGLLGQVDARELVPRERRKARNQARLARARATLQQHAAPGQHTRAQHPQRIARRRRRLERKRGAPRVRAALAQRKRADMQRLGRLAHGTQRRVVRAQRGRRSEPVHLVVAPRRQRRKPRGRHRGRRRQRAEAVHDGQRRAVRKRKRRRERRALVRHAQKPGPPDEVAHAEARVLRAADLRREPLRKGKHALGPHTQRGRQLRVHNRGLVRGVVDGRHPDLGEAVAQRGAQLLLAIVAAGVHRRNHLEAIGSRDNDVVARLLGQHERALALKHTVQALKHAVVRKRHLVEQQVLAAAHRLDEGTIDPGKQRGRLGHLGARSRRLGRVDALQRSGHVLKCAVRDASTRRRRPRVGRERRAVPHRALAAEQIRAVCALVAVERVQAAARRRGKHVAHGRLAGTRLADQEYRLVLVQRRGRQAHEAAQRRRPHEAGALRGRAQRREALRAELRTQRRRTPIQLVDVDAHAHHLFDHCAHRVAVGRVARAFCEQHVARVRKLLVADGAARAPAKEVAQRRKCGLFKHTLRRAAALQLGKHGNDALCVRRRNRAAPRKDRRKLSLRHVVKVQLDKAVAERAAQHLAPGVCARRVLRRKQHKLRMRADDLARLGQQQLAVVVEQAVQRLEHVGRRKVQLVQHEPVATAQRRHQQALGEHELPIGVRRVRAEVLLHVRVLVVVDAHKAVARTPRKVLDGARLARARRALDEDRTRAPHERTRQRAQLCLDTRRHHIVRRRVRRQRTDLEPEAADQHVAVVGRRRDVPCHALIARAVRDAALRHRAQPRSARCVQQRRERQRNALGQRAAQAVPRCNRSRKRQRPRERAHRVVRPLSRAVR